MAYREDEYKYGPFIEHEIKFAGQCGAKGGEESQEEESYPGAGEETKSIQQGKENIEEDPLQL